jgi:RNA recognition motif-containing protein
LQFGATHPRPKSGTLGATHKEILMGKKLYVGNLPYSATEASLREMFAPLGEVTSVAIITDRDSGRSKGFGFVEMATEAAAQQAIAQLNGKNMDERAITVAEARPQADRGGFGGGSRGGFGGSRGGFGGSRGGRPGGGRR